MGDMIAGLLKFASKQVVELAEASQKPQQKEHGEIGPNGANDYGRTPKPIQDELGSRWPRFGAIH
jgi:hypothetical protein